jgi:hypothetical protein
VLLVCNNEQSCALVDAEGGILIFSSLRKGLECKWTNENVWFAHVYSVTLDSSHTFVSLLNLVRPISIRHQFN